MKAIECFSVSISGGYGRRLVIKGPVDSREHAAAPGFSKSAVRGADILLEYGRGRLFSIFKCSIFRQPGNSRHRWYRPCSWQQLSCPVSCASRILLVLNVPDSGGAPCIYGGVTLIWPVFLEVVCNLCLLYFSNVLATRKPSAQTTIGLRVRYSMQNSLGPNVF